MPDDFYCVIPAGGSGTRLWPLSRSHRPKFLIPLMGERSLLQQTVDRLAPLASPERMWLVAGASHAVEISRQLPELPASRLIIEPAPRGTGPAIALAATLIAREKPNAILGSFAADHIVRDSTQFESSVLTAIEAAKQGLLVTIGVTPTRPVTGYGYIERTDEIFLRHDGHTAFIASGFVEKPDRETAAQFVQSGRYFWNSSMFVSRADVLLATMKTVQPDLSSALSRILEAWDSEDRDEILASEWQRLSTTTIDQGIMEKIDRFAVVPASMGWSDVGDWNGIGELIDPDRDANCVKGDLLQHDSSNCVVWSETGRLVALVGVHELAIVDTPDALLIVDRTHAQDVRQIVEMLEARRSDLK
jgi:mannose-1-phosphate guanylyltransferase